MKTCMCSLCFYPAAYVSKNSPLKLCEDCYYSVESEYEQSEAALESGMSFEDYYDFEEVDDD